MHLAIGGCLKAPPIDYGITADTGGHIAYVIGAATAQSAAGMSISIVTRAIVAADLPGRYAEPTEIFGDGIGIVRLSTRNRSYLEKEKLESELPELTGALISHIHSLPRRPDVIHAHFSDAAAMALAVRETFGIPFVYTPHALGQAIASAARTASRILRERQALAGADAVVVSSRDEAITQIGAHGVTVPTAQLHRIPPGVPEHCLAPAPGVRDTINLPAFLDDPGKPVVLAIARPVRKKNLGGILRAYAGSHELKHRANLVIFAGCRSGAASGEQDAVLAELHDLIDGSKLTGRVAMPARHTAADVAALYGRAAEGGVFVNPAIHEPFGLTLLEAAAHGVPVVSTGSGGARDLVQDIGHGILVDPHDEPSIAEACLMILKDPDTYRRFARNGRRNVTRYDWGRYAEQTKQLYFSLASRGVPAAGLLTHLGASPVTPVEEHAVRMIAADPARQLVATRSGATPGDPA